MANEPQAVLNEATVMANEPQVVLGGATDDVLRALLDVSREARREADAVKDEPGYTDNTELMVSMIVDGAAAAARFPQLTPREFAGVAMIHAIASDGNKQDSKITEAVYGARLDGDHDLPVSVAKQRLRYAVSACLTDSERNAAAEFLLAAGIDGIPRVMYPVESGGLKYLPVKCDEETFNLVRVLLIPALLRQAMKSEDQVTPLELAGVSESGTDMFKYPGTVPLTAVLYAWRLTDDPEQQKRLWAAIAARYGMDSESAWFWLRKEMLPEDYSALYLPDQSATGTF